MFDLLILINLFVFALSRLIIIIGKTQPIYKSEREVNMVYLFSYMSIGLILLLFIWDFIR